LYLNSLLHVNACALKALIEKSERGIETINVCDKAIAQSRFWFSLLPMARRRTTTAPAIAAAGLSAAAGR
jgi:hypothetical protein